MTKNAVRHTPGPWVISSSLLVCDKDARIITSAINSDIDSTLYIDYRERVANTKLIASAPELLEALKEARKQYGAFVEQAHLSKDEYHKRQLAKCDKAIAKAEGKL